MGMPKSNRSCDRFTGRLRLGVGLMLMSGLAATSEFPDAGTAWAAEYSPRLHAVGQPDTHSLRTWAASLGEVATSDADFAVRLLTQLTGPRGGMRLSNVAPQEGPDKLADFARVTDPLKLWLVYGYGDERQLAGMFVAVWEASGRGRGRLAVFGNTGHCFAEVESDGRWWAFDVARCAMFRKSETSFASAKELLQDEKLWQPPAYASLLPDETPSLRPQLVDQELRYEYDTTASGHTGDFVLRRGERFIRFAQPQGARFAISPLQIKDKALLQQLQNEPVGPKSLRGDGPTWSNGQFVYAPDLQSDAGPFQDGVVASENVRISDVGLTVEKAGVGWAIFEVRSPYLIVPEVNKLDDPKDDKQAATINLDAAGITLSYSPDNTATWISLDAKTFPIQLDLTAQVAGSYGYLLRIELNGQPDKAVVKSLKFTTHVQVSPRSWPQAIDHTHDIAFRRHDEFGLPTRVFAGITSTSNENSFLAPVIRPPREIQTGDASRRVLGPFTLRVSPPVGSRLTWFRYGGRFAVHAEQPELGQILLSNVIGQPLGFQPQTVAPLPADHAGTDRQLDELVRLDEPVTAAYVWMEGRPALNDLRLTAHGIDVTPRPAAPWAIIHRWRTGDDIREQRVGVTAELDRYKSEAPSDAVAESLEFHCP